MTHTPITHANTSTSVVCTPSLYMYVHASSTHVCDMKPHTQQQQERHHAQVLQPPGRTEGSGSFVCSGCTPGGRNPAHTQAAPLQTHTLTLGERLWALLQKHPQIAGTPLCRTMSSCVVIKPLKTMGASVCSPTKWGLGSKGAPCFTPAPVLLSGHRGPPPPTGHPAQLDQGLQGLGSRREQHCGAPARRHQAERGEEAPAPWPLPPQASMSGRAFWVPSGRVSAPSLVGQPRAG